MACRRPRHYYTLRGVRRSPVFYNKNLIARSRPSPDIITLCPRATRVYNSDRVRAVYRICFVRSRNTLNVIPTVARVPRTFGSVVAARFLRYVRPPGPERTNLVRLSQWYSVDGRDTDARVYSAFVQMHADADTRRFLDESAEQSDRLLVQVWRSLASSVLNAFMTKTSVNG